MWKDDGKDEENVFFFFALPISNQIFPRLLVSKLSRLGLQNLYQNKAFLDATYKLEDLG